MRRALVVLALAALTAAGCGPGEVATNSKGQKVVTVGTVNGSSSDAAVFIAKEKGFFADENIAIDLQGFNTGAQFVAPLGSGRLNVGSGGISAGVFNAVNRKIGLRLVADKSRAGKPSYTSLLVRKGLKFDSMEDLRGKTIALPSLGVPPHYELSLWLKQAGMTTKDVRIEQIGFPDMVSALANGSVDAAVSIEPSASQAISKGGARRVATSDEVFPREQTAAIFYSQDFIEDSPDVAQDFMDAYMRGVRFYKSALRGSKLTGPRGREIAEILTKYTPVKDPAVFLKTTLHDVDADGRLSPDLMQRDVDYWASQGLIKGGADVDDAVDTTFLDKTIKRLGTAKEAAR